MAVMDEFLWQKAREMGIEKKLQEAVLISALPLPYPPDTPPHEFYSFIQLEHYRFGEDGFWEEVTPPTADKPSKGQ